MKFLVKTKKDIFAYKLFLSLYISDFSFFYVNTAPLPLKKSPLLSQQPPSENWDPVKPPLFENLVGGSSLPCSNGRGGAHYDFGLTHFMPVFYFYTLWKHQKARSLLMFKGYRNEKLTWNEVTRTVPIKIYA